MNELALFAGCGGSILAGKLLGWRTVCAVEVNEYARRVLMQRQDDGILDPFPIWDDVRTFDGREWRGKVSVITGGFPCQDISWANSGAEGIDGKRSGLWGEMARIIREVEPRNVIVENSPMLVGRGLARVLGDLASMGYDARWGVMGGPAIGAATSRERLWLVAYPVRGRWRDWWAGGARRRDGGKGKAVGNVRNGTGGESPRLRQTEPEFCGVASRVADQLDEYRTQRLRGIGNGQIPGVAAMAWRLLGENTKDQSSPSD